MERGKAVDKQRLPLGVFPNFSVEKPGGILGL
jgi:hypothetical protein